MAENDHNKKEEKVGAETPKEYPESVLMDLKTVKVGDSHAIHIQSVRAGVTKSGQDYIVATTESNTLEGNTIWFKGAYGLQNGYQSVLKNSEGVVEGEWIYSKVESERSPVGYAHRWVKA